MAIDSLQKIEGLPIHEQFFSILCLRLPMKLLARHGPIAMNIGVSENIGLKYEIVFADPVQLFLLKIFGRGKPEFAIGL